MHRSILLPLSLPNNPSHKICSRCAAPFSCRPDDISHCDCTRIELSIEETRFISVQYKDCVCNACLLELKETYHSQEKTKAIFCWSGGKDSAYALYQIILENRYDVTYLLTTVNKTFQRISMHGVRETLLQAQAEALGFPLLKVEVEEGSNAEYERQMEAVLLKAKAEGIGHVIFGDIFLEDLRAYREANLAKVDMVAVFPLWKRPTIELVRDFINQKFRTVLCCTNDAYLGEEWVGREIDESFLKELPATVDPCGENGEYHTFCFDGPVFRKSISFQRGETVYKPLEVKTTEAYDGPVTKGFWFIDLF
jgi:uncharacterized protein (TIGR00290 family)